MGNCEGATPRIYVQPLYESYVFDPLARSFVMGFYLRKICTGFLPVKASIGAFATHLTMNRDSFGYDEGFVVITFTLKESSEWSDLMPCDDVDTPFYVPIQFSVPDEPMVSPVLAEIYLDHPCGKCAENDCACEAWSFINNAAGRQIQYYRDNGSWAQTFTELGYAESQGVDPLAENEMNLMGGNCYRVTLTTSQMTNGCPETVYGAHMVFIPGANSGGADQYAASIYYIPSLETYRGAYKVCKSPAGDPPITPPLMEHSIITSCSNPLTISCQGSSTTAPPTEVDCPRIYVAPCEDGWVAPSYTLETASFADADPMGTAYEVPVPIGDFVLDPCCANLFATGDILPAPHFDENIISATVDYDAGMGGAYQVTITKESAALSGPATQCVVVRITLCGVTRDFIVPVIIS